MHLAHDSGGPMSCSLRSIVTGREAVEVCPRISIPKSIVQEDGGLSNMVWTDGLSWVLSQYINR